MEFMNVGGGELLIIILLALVLFSPEDILKLMRTIGKYARTARQMWSNVSKSLQEDYIPDEVKEVVQETASSVKEARTTLTNIREQFNDITTSVKDEVSDATQLADTEISEAVSTINETPDSDNHADADLDGEVEISSEIEDTSSITDNDSAEESILPPDKMPTSDAVASHPPHNAEQDTLPANVVSDQIQVPTTTNDLDASLSIDDQTFKVPDATASKKFCQCPYRKCEVGKGS